MRIIWFGLFGLLLQGICMQHVLAGAGHLVLVCSVEGIAVTGAADFAAVFCAETKSQLEVVTGRSVEQVDSLPEDIGGGWVRLMVQIRSPQGLTAHAEWDVGDGEVHRTPTLEAGVDDARLNYELARMVVTGILSQISIAEEP